MKLRLPIFALALLFIPLLAQAQVVAPASDTLASVEPLTGWQVFPQPAPSLADQPPAADAPGWIPLAQYRSREYRLAHRREPGLWLWLQATVTVGKVPAEPTVPVVLNVENYLATDRAWLNGSAMKNVYYDTARPLPHPLQFRLPRKPDGELPWVASRDKGALANMGNIFWTNYTLFRYDTRLFTPDSPMFTAPASTLRAGGNRLVLGVVEQDLRDDATGAVELRSARLSDRVQLNSFGRPVSDTELEPVVLVQPGLPNAKPVTVTITVQDDLGTVRWSEKRTVDFGNPQQTQGLVLKSRSLGDYKAVVSVQEPGQETVDHWLYFNQSRKQESAFRDEVALNGMRWEFRPINQDEPGTYPAPADGWKPGKPARGAHFGFRHRLYLRTSFTVPADFRPGRQFFCAAWLRMKCDIFINGKALGTRRYYDTPFEMDTLGALKPGQPNELLVVLHDGMTPEFLTAGTPPVADGTKAPPPLTSLFHFDNWDFVALDQLSLRRYPELRVERTRIVTSLSQQTLTVTTRIENAAPIETSVKPTYLVTDRAGKVFTFAGKPTRVPAGQSVEVVTQQTWKKPQLWSPENPALYVLETTLTPGEENQPKVLDVSRERFGFREIAIRGADILLNGKIIRFRVCPVGNVFTSRNTQDEPREMIFDTNVASVRDMQAAGYNALRVRDFLNDSRLYDVADELGMPAGFLSELVDNHNQKIAFTDPQTYANSVKELQSQANAWFNHPSSVWYDLGNEVEGTDGHGRNPQVSEFLAGNQAAIKAFDPTRFIFSSGATLGFRGKAEVFAPHYPGSSNVGGNLSPFQWYFYGLSRAQLPEVLKQRVWWYDFDPDGSKFGPLHVRWPGVYQRQVPFFNDETAWQRGPSFNGNVVADGVSYLGERAAKPFSPTFPIQSLQQAVNWRRGSTGDLLTHAYKHDQDNQANRAIGAAGLTPWENSFISPRFLSPAVAYWREYSSAFFAGEPIQRTVQLINDTISDTEVAAELSLYQVQSDGTRSRVLQQRLGRTLKPGGIETLPVVLPAPVVQQPTDYIAELVQIAPGRPELQQRQTWTVFPKNWAGQVPSLTVAVYDPNHSLDGLLEPFGLSPQVITEVTQIPTETRLLIIGENAPPEPLRLARVTTADFMAKGGTVLVMRQVKNQGIKGWLPVDFTSEVIWSTGQDLSGSFTSINEPFHPLFQGLLPDDLRQWGDYGLVFSAGYKLGGLPPTVRALAGIAPTTGHLFEGRFGQGRYLVNLLELTPESVKKQPIPARILANLLRYADQPPSAISSSTTLVYGSAESAEIKSLKDLLRALATYTDQVPKDLTGVQTLVLSGWTEKAPSTEFATTVKAFLNQGGTVLAHRGGKELAAWLGTVTERSIETIPSVNNWTATTLLIDPVLAGVSDGDLFWWDTKKGGIKQTDPGAFASQLYRIPESTGLILPTYGSQVAELPSLTRVSVGRGLLLSDQSNWASAEVIRSRALRYQATLLGNLGVRFTEPKVTPPATFSVPAGLAFAPIPLASAANFKRGVGPDLNLANWKLLRIAGVPFTLPAPESPQGVVVLFGGIGAMPESETALFGTLPKETQPIAVNAKADRLFFAHTAFYHAALANTVVLTYEVRYKGHETVIGGADTDLIQNVPVRAGEDIGDWYVSSVPGANAALEPTVNGGKAAVYLVQWVNPFPDRVIDSIVIRTAANRSVPFVLGITAGVKTR